MSQSEAHRTLVEMVTTAIEKRHQGIVAIADLQLSPGDELPPLIDGFRSDVYARNNQMGLIIIGEAKTDNDIDNRHTYDQITSFINYLERQKKGNLILAVTGISADRAKTLLRFIRRELGVEKTIMEVFDCCDFWRLDPSGGIKWHLI